MRYLFASLLLAISLHNGNAETTEQQEKPKLADFKSCTFSQFGEDGILDTIFHFIGTESKRCIEFGAWDGFYLSNVANLFVNNNWEAILIECDPIKFGELVKNVAPYKCTCLCEPVGIGSQSLESILTKYSIPFSTIDLLSIDIDGNDYYIFESLEKMRPRVIVCEYNPTFPAHLDIYAPYDHRSVELKCGCSVGALMRLAKQKDYTLVAITDTNAFFVRNDVMPHLSDFELSLDKIKIDRYIRYLVTDYTGRYAVIGSENFQSPFGCNGPLPEPLLGKVKKIAP
jgi:hypothetical protein